MPSNRVRICTFLLLSITFTIASCRLLTGNQSAEQSLGCAEGYNQGMSGHEIAELLGLPLAQINPLPNYINSEPQIILAVDYPSESAVCGLEVQYFSQNDNSVEIAIKIFETSGSLTDWLCLDFEEENNSGMGYFRSVCSRTLATDEKKLFVRIYSQEASDITIQLADNLEWFGDDGNY